MDSASEYELLDVGDGARLERFGDRIVDRPHPAALGPRREPGAWSVADLRFDRDRGWTGPAAEQGSWPIEVAGLSLELRPTDAGQVGLFPEHEGMLPWLLDAVENRRSGSVRDATPASRPAVLHLFAYTGLATLAMASAGAAVTHVDSARPTVAWARRNAQLAALDDRPIRWIVDDARVFAEREVRRGRRYAGVVLDPPSYGHGPDGRAWRLIDHLEGLLATCAGLLEPAGFVLLTAHTPGFDGAVLGDMLARAVDGPTGAIDRGALVLRARTGDQLELGAFARRAAGAS
jgi:23S rRNA (cytosine1962-C5)-methyltransferase